MILTNEYGAPDAFVKAIEGDPYTKGDADFSATELLKPPQIVRGGDPDDLRPFLDLAKFRS